MSGQELTLSPLRSRCSFTKSRDNITVAGGRAISSPPTFPFNSVTFILNIILTLQLRSKQLNLKIKTNITEVDQVIFEATLALFYNQTETKIKEYVS